MTGNKEILETTTPATKNLSILLKSEVYKILSSYLEICLDKMFCDLSLDFRGEYVFRCKVYAKDVKPLHFLGGEK